MPELAEQAIAEADPIVAAEPSGAAASAISSEPSASASTAAAAPDASEWTGLRDYAKTLGYDLSSFSDDNAAATALVQAYGYLPQLQQLAQYGQEYVRHQDQFQKYLAAQAGQQVQQPQQPKSWWSPPANREEVQKLVEQWYTRDPATGTITPHPTAPPSVTQKVADYLGYVQDWKQRLEHNPQEALREAAREEAQRIFDERWQVEQAKQEAVRVANQHANWMFHKRQDGSIAFGQYTPEGHAFWQYVQMAARQGIQDVRGQEYFALGMLERDILRSRLGAASQPAPAIRPAATPNPGATRQANSRVNGQAVPRGAGALTAMLRQEFRANGVSSDIGAED